MLTRNRVRFIVPIAGLFIIAAIVAGVAVQQSGGAESKPQPPFGSEAEAPPHGASFQFIDGSTGRFRVALWDDRQLTEEQRRANPIFNPAWKPFSACLAQRGLELRADPSQRFAQADLDAVIHKVNTDSVKRDENLDLAGRGTPQRAEAVRARPHQAAAAAYLDCAGQWLTLSAQQVFEKTGEPNDWYPRP